MGRSVAGGGKGGKIPMNIPTLRSRHVLPAMPPSKEITIHHPGHPTLLLTGDESKSLNTVVVEALARGLELDALAIHHTDLDSLTGSWQEDADFDKAMADFERVDEDAWK